MSTVSIIIPAHDAEQCLATCLNSVMGQTLLPDEVIVVNDGSTDHTGFVAEQFGDEIIYVVQEHAGPGAARNRGLGIATGDYIAFLDADDYWLPRFLERTCAFLEQHSGAVAVSCAFKTRLANGDLVSGPPCVRDGVLDPESQVLQDFFRFWAREDHVRTGTALIRRSVIEHAGGQRADLRISQDLEYWGYLATFGLWGFIREPLWVGNSRAAARTTGWHRKYAERRSLCPTVESWQERILPRLSDEALPHFCKVRGRVAAGYAHSKLLGGSRAEARRIVRLYGDSFPRNRVTTLMQFGSCCGSPGWRLVCWLLSLRESLK